MTCERCANPLPRRPDQPLAFWGYAVTRSNGDEWLLCGLCLINLVDAALVEVPAHRLHFSPDPFCPECYGPEVAA